MWGGGARKIIYVVRGGGGGAAKKNSSQRGGGGGGQGKYKRCRAFLPGPPPPLYLMNGPLKEADAESIRRSHRR